MTLAMKAPARILPGPMAGELMKRPLPEPLRLALDLVGVTLIALFLAGFVERNVTHQGDLKTYQLAARAALDGLDPYEPGTLSTMAGRRVFPFVYPPVALLPFMAAASLPPKAVAVWWMWLKIGLLVVLVFAWAKWFVRDASLLALGLVAAFGWNSSAQWDLGAGNVAIIECCLLWAGFGCYVAGRRGWFALLVITAACFKITPAVFLLLLLVPTSSAGRSPARFAAASVALALVVLGPTLVGPAAHFTRFWSHVPDATGYGDANPSALGFATVLAGWIGAKGAVAWQVATAVWVAYAAALITCSVPVLKSAHGLRDARRWVMIAVFMYVLLQPRPMAYGFVLLAPAPFFFAPKPFASHVGRLVLSMVLAAQGLWRLTQNRTGSPLVTYAPFLLSLCVWLLIVNEQSTSAAASRGSNVEELAAPREPAEKAA